MRRFKNFLEDPSQQMARTTAYNRRLARMHNDDSSEDENRRRLLHQVVCEHQDSDSLTSHEEETNMQQFEENAIEIQNATFESNQSEDPGRRFMQNNEFAYFVPSDVEDDNFNRNWEQDLPYRDEGEDDDEQFYDANEQFVDEELNNIEPPVNKLEQTLRRPDTNEVITIPINVSVADVLLAVLKFSLVYNLPQTAIADLFKMLNCFFLRPIFDDTRYMIDLLFYCKNNVDYHSLCPYCKEYVKKFDKDVERSARCNVCLKEFSLRDPTYTDFFTIIDPEKEIAHLIQENYQHYQSVINDIRQESIYELHTGGLYKQLRNSLAANKQDSFVTASFNSDGSPVFESSTYSIWPVQLVINELPYSIRVSRPVVCGLWFGKKKPDMNVFLEPFVGKMNRLANEGFVCNIANEERRLFLYCICCCVDSQARAPMQGIKQYNGYYGCSWCLHPGYYVGHGRGGCVKYILIDEPLQPRTDISILKHAEDSILQGHSIFGIKYLTILSDLQEFKLKSSFVPDSMHCIDLGIAGQFIKYWLESNNKPYSLTKSDIDKIDGILMTVKVPKKIARFSRSITDRSFWKAREWQNWILYYSMPILLSFPHLRLYAEHWNLLVQSYFILMKKDISLQDLHKADRMLKKFVVYTEYYYSRSAMTYNVHQMLHLAQSVADWGPLWAHCGYFFESGNGCIIQKVHAAKGVLNQICRKIAMDKSEFILRSHVELNPDSQVLPFVKYLDKKDATSTLKLTNCTYFGPDYPISLRWMRQLNLSDESRIYRKMVKNQCVFTSLRNIAFRSNNTFAVTERGYFIQIIDFIVDPILVKEFTICYTVNTEDIILNDENVSSTKRITCISDDCIALETNTIDRICVQISTDDNNRFISPVPNLYSY